LKPGVERKSIFRVGLRQYGALQAAH
jgi:hypothetical protein